MKTPSDDARHPNVRRFLDLSTGHLSVETRTYLDEQGRIAAIRRPTSGPAPHPDFLMGSTAWGWIVWAGMEDDSQNLQALPIDLQRCIRFAKEQDCDYILFDADIEELDELKTYEDDEALEIPFSPPFRYNGLAQRARIALLHLQFAREELIKAKATRAVDRVRYAISSVKGAVRAAGYREYREIDAQDQEERA